MPKLSKSATLALEELRATRDELVKLVNHARRLQINVSAKILTIKCLTSTSKPTK